jgi:hypothetical protein
MVVAADRRIVRRTVVPAGGSWAAREVAPGIDNLDRGHWVVGRVAVAVGSHDDRRHRRHHCDHLSTF